MAITILILDDQLPDLSLIQQMVQEDFPEVAVLWARSTEEAHAYIDDGHEVSLFLVADMIGDVAASDFLADLRTVVPGAKAIIMQGVYSFATIPREEELGIVGILQKPVQRNLLREALTVYLHFSPEKYSGFQMTLNHSPLVDLIHWRSTHQAIGALTIRSGHQVGRLYLGKGEIVYAAVGLLPGQTHHFQPTLFKEEAVLEIIKWRSGKVTDGSNEVCPESPLLHRPLFEILLNRKNFII